MSSCKQRNFRTVKRKEERKVNILSDFILLRSEDVQKAKELMKKSKKIRRKINK